VFDEQFVTDYGKADGMMPLVIEIEADGTPRSRRDGCQGIPTYAGSFLLVLRFVLIIKLLVVVKTLQLVQVQLVQFQIVYLLQIVNFFLLVQLKLWQFCSYLVKGFFMACYTRRRMPCASTRK